MAAPTTPSVHGVFRIPSTSTQGDVWGGRFTFTSAGSAAGTQEVVNINDSNFTSRVVRASNHILVTPADAEARGLVWANTGNGNVFLPVAIMTNNSTISFTYTSPDTTPRDCTFYFLIFAGGTNT